MYLIDQMVYKLFIMIPWLFQEPAPFKFAL